jgi:hypothetical protein
MMNGPDRPAVEKDGSRVRNPGQGTPVDDAVLSAILRRPGRYYVNVHTAAFGGGAVRGQLFR